MHIPDGYLTDPVCALTGATAAAALGVSMAGLRRASDSNSCQWMAVTGAGIFAAQMINFPIDHGTSGHVLGAALAAIMLGPWAAIATMTLVLAAQCCLFGDGGLTALGANALNMAVIATLSASAVYAAAGRLAPARGTWLPAILAAFSSVMAAALMCSFELAASGAQPLSQVLPAMALTHLPIAGAEALITLAVLAAVSAARVRLPVPADQAAVRRKRIAAGLALSVAVAVLLSPLSSALPDGLERTAEDLGFANLANASVLPSFAADYLAPALVTALTGSLGVMAVFITTLAAARAATCKVRKR